MVRAFQMPFVYYKIIDYITQICSLKRLQNMIYHIDIAMLYVGARIKPINKKFVNNLTKNRLNWGIVYSRYSLCAHRL